MNTKFQSIFHKFLIGLCRICLRAKVHHLVFNIGSFVEGTNETNELKAIQFNSFSSQFPFQVVSVVHISPSNNKVTQVRRSSPGSSVLACRFVELLDGSKCLQWQGLTYPLPGDSLLLHLLPVVCHYHHSV